MRSLAFLGIFLVVLFALVSAPALAQPEVPRSLNVGQTVLTFYGGQSGGFIGAVATGVLLTRLGVSPDAALITGVVVYPLATAAASYGIGRALGADGTFRGTLIGSAVGAGVGVGLGMLSGALAARSAGCTPLDDVGVVFECITDGLKILSAIVVPYVLAPPIGAVVGFNVSVQPSAVMGPDGEVAPGLSLRVGL